MSRSVEGGCLCGNVRYKISGHAVMQFFCFCTDCQTISGAAGYAAYGVPIASVELTKGQPCQFDKQADSGRINSRRFCGKCGTRLWAQLDELGLASINALTLDDKSLFGATQNHLPESAPSWCILDRTLETLAPIPRE
jgi:hypothetical protein